MVQSAEEFENLAWVHDLFLQWINSEILRIRGPGIIPTTDPKLLNGKIFIANRQEDWVKIFTCWFIIQYWSNSVRPLEYKTCREVCSSPWGFLYSLRKQLHSDHWHHCKICRLKCIYEWDVFIIIKSIKLDLFYALGFGLVGEIISYTMLTVSNSSFKTIWGPWKSVPIQITQKDHFI